MKPTPKPRITYADMQWLQAFNKWKSLPPHTKIICKDGEEVELEFVQDDERWPMSLWLKVPTEGKPQLFILRLGDPMIHELAHPASHR